MDDNTGKMYNQVKGILNYKYTVFIFAFLILIMAFTVKIELVEPLIILFVIYSSINYRKKGAIYSAIFAILTLTIQDLLTLQITMGSYLIEVVTILIAAFYIMKSTANLRGTNHKLKERVKELRVLFKISKIIDDPDAQFEKTIHEIIQTIPPGWQYPEDTCVRIKYKDKEYKSDNFRETKWKQKSDIVIDGKKQGFIEIYYLKEHPEEYNRTPFLKEEFELLEDISDRISNVIKSINQEKSIKEKNKFLSITLDSIGDGVIVTDEAGKIVRMNSIAEQLTGWKFSEAEGKYIKKVFNIVNSKTRKPVKNPVKKVFEKGKIVGLANHTKLISKDGTEYHIADSAAPIKDEEENIYGAVMVFRDFTDKYKMNEEIKRREKLFTNAVSEAPYPIMIHSEDGEVKIINKAWTKKSGYNNNDIVELEDWFQHAYGERKNVVKNYVDKLYDKNETINDGEFEIKTKTGEKRIWDFSSAPLGKDENENRLIMSMAVDVTERKQMIHKINKLNRLYSILSDANQTIVRTKSIDELFTKICNIIQNNGDYKSTWIGKIDKENNKLEVSSSNHGQGKLINGIKIDLNNYTEKQNINKAEQLEPDVLLDYIKQTQKEGRWSELIFNKDNSSTAVFPIVVFKELWGIFTLCIDEGNYFDKEEIKLLKELTNDLSFAVESIKTEKLRKETQKRLKNSEEKYRNLFEKAPVGIFKTTSKGKADLVNPKLAEILGFESIDAAVEYYDNLADELYVENKKREEFINKLKKKGYVEDFVYQAYDKNNNKLWLKMDAKINTKKEDGSFTIDGFVEDITEKYKTAKELERSEEKYRSLFENQYSVMMILEPETGEIVDANPAACDYYGWSHQELTSMNINDINILPQEEVSNKLEAIKNEKSHNFQFKHKLANGEIRNVEVYDAPIKIEDKDYLFSIIHDITERKEAQNKIKYISFHDKLTGMYNRAFIEEEMKRVDNNPKLPISIIMGDLNNLKLVNDTYGHEKGDELIKRAGEIIEESCRQKDILARWGGDEFVILLPNTTLKTGEKICERIFNNTQNNKDEILVSISLGCASKDEVQENIFEVLNRAEDRMYKNKLTNRKSGRSNVLSAFLSTLREKSYETEEHAGRMKELSLKLGKKVGLSGTELDRLSLLTSLHDIGKITIPQELLNKEEPLTDHEWELIKKHTEAGYRIVSSMDQFSDIAEYILHHHERWDGSGYPEGLKGEDIPLLSRILSIVDAYDVMTSGRPYKEPISKEEALQEILDCAGSQFDPKLAKEFVEFMK